MVVRAPLSELQKDPTSELLKRFSQDIVQSDDLLPATMFDMIMVCNVICTAFGRFNFLNGNIYRAKTN